MAVTGYSLRGYGSMVTSEPRTAAYVEALRRTVEPGAHVIDLGAGSGFFSLMACKLGAGSVAAIEPDASIEVCRRAAIDNGYANRITSIRDLSTNYNPSEKADVIVSDIRGVLPLFEHNLATIQDARARLLKPDGKLIPAVDRIFAALVEAPDAYDRYRKPWLENGYGLDLSSGYDQVINAWKRIYLPSEALLTEPQLFASLDYSTVEEVNYRADLQFTAKRAGTAHAVLMWFETELAPGIGFSNAPGEPEQVYGQAFFPLEHPVALAKGTQVDAHISANLLNGDYVWSWAVCATDVEGTRHNFRQSSFKANLLDMEALAPRAATFRPKAGKAQEVDIACLGMFDGNHSLQNIAERLSASFPGYFSDELAAFDHVAQLSARYSAKAAG